jgi:hypothetical protein
MARKKSTSSGGIYLVLIIAGVGAIYKWCKENIEILFAGFAVIILWLIIKVLISRKRHADWVRYLRDKYDDENIVNAILGSTFWKGQTQDQLRDSLGHPAIIDSQVLKTKTKEIWKYGEQRKGQFSLKITLENGKVVGWDKKA